MANSLVRNVNLTQLALADTCRDWVDLVNSGYEELADHYVFATEDGDFVTKDSGFVDVDFLASTKFATYLRSALWREFSVTVIDVQVVVATDGTVWVTDAEYDNIMDS